MVSALRVRLDQQVQLLSKCFALFFQRVALVMEGAQPDLLRFFLAAGIFVLLLHQCQPVQFAQYIRYLLIQRSSTCQALLVLADVVHMPRHLRIEPDALLAECPLQPGALYSQPVKISSNCVQAVIAFL
jgi:hypothetical protein